MTFADHLFGGLYQFKFRDAIAFQCLRNLISDRFFSLLIAILI